MRARRWRTPWGDTAPWSAAVAAERGLRIEGWAADTHDWRGDDAATMLAAVLPGLAAGGTVLMHDGIGPGARRRDCRETVRLIAPLCAAVRARGGVVAGRPPPRGRRVMRAVGAARPAGSDPGAALAEVAAGATARDRAAAGFPEEALRALERAGVLAATVPHGASRPAPAAEWDLMRRVARADGSVGRIVDGHLNAVERVATLAPGPLRDRELGAVAAGELRLGVWGADPAPGEGPPARLVGAAADRRVEGVKVFCSGAGGVGRALVTVRGDAVAPVLALVDVTRGVRIDRAWFAGAGMRTSESHRVVFEGAPVLAVLGAPGEITREPWFSRDAIRTAACWAGIADRAADAALDALAAGDAGDLGAAAAGRIMGALATIDRWLAAAAREAADPAADLRDMSVLLRAAVADACRTVTGVGGAAAGARALAGGGDLDRCRRDLDLFLLQHRLEPMVARVGRAELERRR